MEYTKDDVISLWRTVFHGQTDFGSRYLEFLAEVASHENELTQDARQHLDSIWKAVFAQFDNNAEALPESVEKRKARRMFALAGGTHLNASKLFDRLSVATLDAARDVFLPLVQHILDVQYDVTKKNLTGVAEFAKVSLLYWAVDELLVGFHLAQRKFPTQAHAHSRTIFEILDKLELFDVSPIWAEVWASNDRKKIEKELGPSSVRKKLKRDRWDAFFSHLSEVGTHATFRGVQSRTKRDNVIAGDMPRIGMSVGPVVSMVSVTFANSVCIVAAGSITLQAMKAFDSRLNEEECAQVSSKTVDAVDSYLRNYLAVGPDSTEGDANAIDALLLKWKSIKHQLCG
jgi:hypothetical protein